MPQKQTEVICSCVPDNQVYKVLTSEHVTMEAIAHAHSDVLDIEGHFTSWLRTCPSSFLKPAPL